MTRYNVISMECEGPLDDPRFPTHRYEWLATNVSFEDAVARYRDLLHSYRFRGGAASEVLQDERFFKLRDGTDRIFECIEIVSVHLLSTHND